jgi:predicted hydrocarbon binding protein
MSEIINTLEKKRMTLQNAMNFAAAMAYGVEQITGRGAVGMTFVAGRKLGKQISEGARQTDDILEALEEVGKILKKNNFDWVFEPFKPKKQAQFITTNGSGASEIKLVFRDCMIRQSLFCFGHEQKGSLCYMMYGVFSGALDNIMGKKATLDIVHAGDNACLKTLTIEDEQSPA